MNDSLDLASPTKYIQKQIEWLNKLIEYKFIQYLII